MANIKSNCLFMIICNGIPIRFEFENKMFRSDQFILHEILNIFNEIRIFEFIHLCSTGTIQKCYSKEFVEFNYAVFVYKPKSKHLRLALIKILRMK